MFKFTFESLRPTYERSLPPFQFLTELSVFVVSLTDSARDRMSASALKVSIVARILEFLQKNELLDCNIQAK